ncbi:MAG: serine/threonine-protein kinase [Aureliella sp.]
MIARPAECDHAKLVQLLADTLPEHEHAPLTLHLDDCESCRRSLDELTEQTPLFADTQVALSSAARGPDSSNSVSGNSDSLDFQLNSAPLHGMSKSGVAASPLADQEHWVVNLLQPSSASDQLGRLDDMSVEAVLGQGGMGVVVKAHDASLGRDLAVKLLSPMLASCGAARQRFFREAQAAAAIVHPNIVPIFSVSEQRAASENITKAQRAIPYITMPLISGGNLQQVIDRDGPLPLDRVLSIGHQVAEGLAAAHAQGIIHRDIKPANLMLDGGGFRVMITDFGLARALDDSTLTGSGMLAGTPQFMSPEQARGQTLDHRSDIYSLGAVLYALATGRPPVSGTSTMEILHKIGSMPPKPIVEINESYPEWFQRLVQLMMHPNANERIESADQAAVLLRESLAHARSPRRSELPKALAVRDWARPLAIFAGGAALATAVGLAAVALPGGFKWQRSKSVEQSPPAGLSSQPDVPVSEAASSNGVPSGTARVAEWETNQLDQRIDELGYQLQSLRYELGLPDSLEGNYDETN